MLLRNGEKYSCASCIKGHRSSSCQHVDRLLVPVKRKGRPVTQCAHCRELRKSKKLHIKCICAEKAIKSSTGFSCNSPGLASSSSKVCNLLNPCDCTQNSHCQCCEFICRSPSTPYCRPTKSSITKLALETSESSLNEPSILPTLAVEENSSFCACGCRSTSSVPSKSSLTIKDLLNPCKCCIDGKKCGCGHLKKKYIPENSFQNEFREVPEVSVCCSTPSVTPGTNISSSTISCCKKVLPKPHSFSKDNSCFSISMPQILSGESYSSIIQYSSTLDNLLYDIKEDFTSKCQSNCCTLAAGDCLSCTKGCKCGVYSSNPTDTISSTARKEFIDTDGVKNCGCGCYLSSIECTDCIKDTCTEFLFRPPDAQI